MMYFMNFALDQAKLAQQKNEVPVGAVVVQNNKIIASAHNLKESYKDCTAHAELLAIKAAQEVIGDWRLNNCMLYSTLEPCPMCMGAILHARIDKVIYAAKDYKWGACGSQTILSQPDRFNHYTETVFLNDPQCSIIIKQFFNTIRNKRNALT